MRPQIPTYTIALKQIYGRIHALNQSRTRGLRDGDDRLFAPQAIAKLKIAQEELRFLLDRGYPAKSAGAYVGSHHQLSARQQLALSRCTASSRQLANREAKNLNRDNLAGQMVHIDGFNQIIGLEVALSGGMLLIGQDGCVRDLAELRGSYRLINQTGTAIGLIRDALRELNVAKAVFVLDEPVSNSGRLKTLIADARWNIPIDIRIVKSPDSELKRLHYVITGDSAILDECQSWFNLTAFILANDIGSGVLKKPDRIVDLR